MLKFKGDYYFTDWGKKHTVVQNSKLSFWNALVSSLSI